MLPPSHVSPGPGRNPHRTSSPSIRRFRNDGFGLFRSWRSQPFSSNGDRSQVTRPQSCSPHGSIATCAAPPSAYQSPVGVLADAKLAIVLTSSTPSGTAALVRRLGARNGHTSGFIPRRKRGTLKGRTSQLYVASVSAREAPT